MPATRPLSAAIAILALVTVACGGAAAPTATPTKAPVAPTAAAAPTTAPAAAPTPTAPAPAAAIATPTRPAATPTARAAAARGKIIYAKPVDMGRSTTISAAGSAGGPDTPFSSSLNASFTARTLDNQLIPWLASSWKFSSDDKVLDVTIRKGAVFHDGSPVTADDVVFSLDKLWLNTIVPGNVPPSGSRPVLPTKVEKTGPDTVRVTFPEPDPTFLAELMNSEAPGGLINIYPKAVIERVGFDAFYKAPVASGPYKLAKRSPAESLILEAHEQFFNGSPPVKTIEIRIAPEDTTRVAMFRTGEADIAESIAPQFLSDMEKVPGAKILTVRSGQEVVINIQTTPANIPGTDRPNPFRDVRVRRALIYATDKKAIAERIAGRAGVPVVGPYSTFHLGAVPDKIQEYEYNPEKAKQLLKEANFPMDYQFPVYAYVASAPAPQAVESFANYLQAVGLKAQYRLVEVSSLIRMWRTKEAFPMSFVRSWNVYPNPTAHYISYMKSDGGTSFYADPVMDKIWDDARRIVDPAKQAQAFEKFFTYIHEQAYVVDLYAIVDNHGIGPKVDWRYPPGLPSRLDLITWRQ